MDAEELLDRVLDAWSRTDGYTISEEMNYVLLDAQVARTPKVSE